MSPHTITAIFFKVLRKAQWLFGGGVNQRGFTLIELALVLGILVLFLGLSIPQLRSFQQISYVNATGKEVIAVLRLAQSRTLASERASQYGVYFDTSTTPHQYTLFEGPSYSARDPAKDEVTILQKTIEISAVSLGGANEVVFSRLTGQAESPGTIMFRQIADPIYTKTVSILSSGVVQEDSATPPSDSSRVVDSRHTHVSYQGRTISTATESVRLVFPDTTFSFPIAANMVSSEIFWEGDVVSEGETQHMKIHTHVLNDATQGTLFSLHRPLDKNTKAVSIELSGDATGNVISYDAPGSTTKGTSIYATTPDIQ